jgi:hypothetical protein
MEGRASRPASYETHFVAGLVGEQPQKQAEKSSPRGASHLSPALQRWESGNNEPSPGGTGQFRDSLYSSLGTRFKAFLTVPRSIMIFCCSSVIA